MSILDKFIGKLAPHDCIVCGIEGDLLCTACSTALTTLPSRCYRCQTNTAESLTCLICRETSCLNSVYVATAYDKVAKALIWKLKLAGARSAARIMAKHMARLIKGSFAKTVIVPVPTATGRARQRGYDQARLLARELSRQTRLPYLDCLVRSGQTHQHGLSRHERLAQLVTAYRVRRPNDVQRVHIILVDDVATTGATLEAAAAVLQTAGASRIDAVVFAQP